MKARSLQMSSHLPAVWHVPTGPSDRSWLLCISRTTAWSSGGDPALPLGAMGRRAEGALLAKGVHQKARPLNQQSRSHLAQPETRGGDLREGANSHTHTLGDQFHPLLSSPQRTAGRPLVGMEG